MNADHGLRYEPGGDWLCFAGPRLTVLIGSVSYQRRDALWSLVCSAGSSADVLDLLVLDGLRDCPPFAVIDRAADSLRVLARGPVEVRVARRGGRETLSGADVHTWAESGFPPAGTWEAVVLPAPAAAEPAQRLPLLAGVVLVRRVAEARIQVKPEAGAAAEEATLRIEGTAEETGGAGYDHLFGATTDRSVEGAAVRAVEERRMPAWLNAVDLLPDASGESAAAGEPVHDGFTVSRTAAQRMAAEDLNRAGAGGGTARIPGRLCGDAHPNPPDAETCRVCNAPLHKRAPVLVEPPPPGVLRFSTAEVVALDQPVLMGRAPVPAQLDRGPLPRLVTIPSPNDDVSRTHLEVRPDGWRVLVTDLGSANGTTVVLPGERPQRLQPGEPVAIAPGSVVRVAEDVHFTYEAS